MKKHILSIIAACAMAGSVNSYAIDPNRMLVIDPNEQYKAFNVGNVSRIEFATVEGEVAANIQLISHNLTSLKATITRTPECKSFMVNVIPGVLARALEQNPAAAGSYMASAKSPTYSEDFPSGELSGLELEYDTQYALVTLGIDEFGVECDFRAVYFTTEKAPIEGDPKVEFKVLSKTKTTIDFNITPNSDVKEYYYVIFEEGIAQQQFEQWGPAFGFSNIGQMIKMWGEAHTGAENGTYSSLTPNTKYELYVQSVDKNDNMPDVQIFKVETDSQGGPGIADVTVTFPKYELADWNDQMLPSQFITYTPNDQTWCYRMTVLLAAEYDQNADLYKAEMPKDPDQPMAYWFFYDTLTTDYQINPNTEFVVLTVGKNANGEWGEVKETRHTTPAKVDGAPAMKNIQHLNGPAKIAARLAAKSKYKMAKQNISLKQ